MRYKIISSSEPRLIQLAKKVVLLPAEVLESIRHIDNIIRRYPELKGITDYIEVGCHLQSKGEVHRFAIDALYRHEKSNKKAAVNIPIRDCCASLVGHIETILVNKYIFNLESYNALSNLLANERDVRSRKMIEKTKKTLEIKYCAARNAFQRAYKPFYYLLCYNDI